MRETETGLVTQLVVEQESEPSISLRSGSRGSPSLAHLSLTTRYPFLMEEDFEAVHRGPHNALSPQRPPLGPLSTLAYPGQLRAGSPLPGAWRRACREV